MDKLFQIFNTEEGNLLIRLLLAHILADFAFQSGKMVESKTWVSKQMGFHLLIVMICTLLLTFSFKFTIVIGFFHWLIDALKVAFEKRKKIKAHSLFVIDQALHLLVILILWMLHYGLYQKCITLISTLFLDYKISLYILAYSFVIWPLGYLIRFALQKLMPNTEKNSNNDGNNIENAGRLIGQFERIIILTFVLLQQYEAIGFLITGKSIIRFADRNSELKSEYVLVGTMMSYGLCILIGIITTWLMKIAV